MFKVSARRPGSTPAPAAASRTVATATPSPDASAFASVLRRWAKAARTTASKRRSSARSTRGAGSGARRSTADSTFGGGRNARGGLVHVDRGERRAQALDQRAVHLERERASGAPGELAGQGALAGSDLDDQIRRRRRHEVDDRARDPGIAQEVLAERAALERSRRWRWTVPRDRIPPHTDCADRRAARSASSAACTSRVRACVAARSPLLSIT